MHAHIILTGVRYQRAVKLIKVPLTKAVFRATTCGDLSKSMQFSSPLVLHTRSSDAMNAS